MNLRAEAEGVGFGFGLSPDALAKLQSWFSPSFPIGSFSYSHGLEWLVDTAQVRDSGSLAEWVEGVLRHGAGRSDAIVLGAVSRAVAAADWPGVAEISELAIALQPTAERRMESLRQGTAFVTAVAAGWPQPQIDDYRARCPGDVAYPVGVGVATAAHRLPLQVVLVSCLHAFTANLVSAGIRLIPLGQTEGLKLVAALAPVCVAVATDALSAGLDDLGSASFLADIASMQHETQYSRLFRS